MPCQQKQPCQWGQKRGRGCVLIQCSLSPDVTALLACYKWRGQLCSHQPAAMRSHHRNRWFPTWQSRPTSKGAGISLLLMIEDLASSFHTISSFPLWRMILLLYGLSKLTLISAVYSLVHGCMLRSCYACHSVQHSDLNNFVTPNLQPSIDKLSFFFFFFLEGWLYSCEL